MAPIWGRVLWSLYLGVEAKLVQAVLRIPAFHHGVRRIHRTIEDFRYGRNPHEPLRPGEATEDPEKVRGDGGGFLRYFVEELRNQARGGSGSGTNPPGPPASRG